MTKTVVEAVEVTKAYGTMKALDRVSFRLEADKIYGLLGRNGAGKTTLTVKGAVTPKLKRQAESLGLELGPVSLQQLFIHLTNHASIATGKEKVSL